MNEIAEIAFAIARTNEPATEKLDQLLTAIHGHTKMTLVKERYMHDLIATATRENWAIAKAHIERMVAIVEAIIREGIEDAAEAARAVRLAFMPFFHPILIEHCVQQRGDTEADMRGQIRFILKALGRSDQAACRIPA
ncbi:TetR/AcrR family transcriptional regulator [Bradyrhizobium zhanjiangense]|uniref:TetR/AcrR family transcriptional regulator n=1 Tax=Bradyrhizobium zhanjiangense TaxID=1325107 RepID=UPI001FE191A7|nr:TetR/AcrR family transcriptional regulator [Bradyrhizobium zhanjiangense]